MACDNDDYPTPEASTFFSLNSIDNYYTNALYKHTYLHYPALTGNLEIRFLILFHYSYWTRISTRCFVSLPVQFSWNIHSKTTRIWLHYSLHQTRLLLGDYQLDETHYINVRNSEHQKSGVASKVPNMWMALQFTHPHALEATEIRKY